MAAATKTALSPHAFASQARNGVNLDFAANPNHYRLAAKVGKAKPKRAPAPNLTPRLVLELTLKCETSQLPDSDYDE